MNKTEADKVLFEFGDVAEGLGLDWFLFAGTCLGLYRDGQYLPGDNDIDVGVKGTPGQLRHLWDTLDSDGFTLGKFHRNVDGSQNRHVYGGLEKPWPKADDPEVMVDVWFGFTEDEENLLMNYGQIRYQERDILVPYPVDVYLQLAYDEWWDKDQRKQAKGKEDALEH